MGRSQSQNINFVGDNYSRYGTSIYQQLYNSPSKGNNNNNNNKLNQAYAGSITSDHSLQNKKSTNKLTKIPSYDPDNESIMTNGSRTSKIKRKYKSLLSSSSKKLINKLYYDHAGAGPSDSFSIFSSKSHKDNFPPLNNTLQSITPVFNDSFANINDLPLETLARIISYIDQEQHYKTIVYCLYVSKKWYKATKIVIYQQPRLISTYRVAQFVTSLRLHPENGALVKSLNLSNLKNGFIIIKDTDINININNDIINNSTLSADNDNVQPTEVTTATNNNEPINDIAYAGWRDWRYRNDPLYSSPMLNSYTIKRVVTSASSSSSIHSNLATLNNGSVTSINTSISSTKNDTSNSTTIQQHNASNRARSNSSVSSITSSIMSSFQNNSHLSLTSSNYNSNNSSPLLNYNNNTGKFKPFNDNSNHPSLQKQISNPNSNSNTSLKEPDNSKWFRFNIAYKNKRRVRNLKNYSTQQPLKATTSNTTNNNNNNNTDTTLLTTSDSNNNDHTEIATSSSQIQVIPEQPFKTKHPYTNKFLLKYAPYKDLPLGYILHILHHCPNLESLDLSNLVICNDFKVIHKSKHHKRMTSLILPSVEESTVMNDSEADRLDVIYATDSSKNYEQNKDIILKPTSHSNGANTSSSSINKPNLKSRPLSVISASSSSSSMDSHSTNRITGLNPSYWLSASNGSRSDYPLPIDSQTKSREMEKSRRYSNKNLKNNVELLKLNPVEIFEFLCSNDSSLSSIKMDGAVWCRQYMIKYFILNTFKDIIDYDANMTRSNSIDSNKIMDLSFLKAGMNRNFAWSCKGAFSDFVVLIILDELLKRDDLAIEDIFNIKSERFYESQSFMRDSDIIEISSIFPIKYGLDDDQQHTMKFRLVILKNERPTSYTLKKLSNDYTSLVINLCINENYNFMVSSTGSEILPKETPKRIDRLAHGLVAKVRSLRNNDLRRNVGQNNYIHETIAVI